MPETVTAPVASPEAMIGELGTRLEAIERLLTLIPIGFCGIWPGEPPPSTTGEVQLRPGLLLCNGAEVSQLEWPHLWRAWGQTHRYGSPTDPANFRLPNLIDRMPWARAASGTRGTVGAQGGLDRVQLAIGELPIHSHTITGSVSVSINPAATGISVRPPVGAGMAFNNSTDTKSLSPTGGGYSSPNTSQALAVTDPGHTHSLGPVSHTLQGANVGSGQSHENMPPYVIVEAWGVIAGLKAV